MDIPKFMPLFNNPFSFTIILDSLLMSLALVVESTTGYDSTQQDVIIGSFMCAYLGETPTLSNINPMSMHL